MIPAIETEYHGYRFRSRTEARWAIYFDAVGLLWDYELEGYRLKSGPYLPDFWISNVNMWAEVKPRAFTKRECLLAEQLPANKPYTAYVPDGGQSVDFCLLPWRDEERLYASYGQDDILSSPVIDNAVESARRARFEHGERVQA